MTSTGDKTDKILEQVRLLLQRADNTPYEHEAQLCRERAERLIIKHSITSLDEPSKIMRLTISLNGYATAAYPKQLLLASIAEVFGCKLVSRSKRECYLVGQSNSLDLCWELFQHLEIQLDGKLYDPNGPRGTSAIHSFAHGWVGVVGQRIDEMYRQEIDESASTGYDLVLSQNMDAVDQYLKENGVVTKKQIRGRSSLQGMSEGAMADIGVKSRKVEPANYALEA